MDLKDQLAKEQEQLQNLIREAAFVAKQLAEIEATMHRQSGVVQTLNAIIQSQDVAPMQE